MSVLARGKEEEVTVITQLGEQVPGKGLLTVVAEKVEQLWPKLSAVASTPSRGLAIQGWGFLAN